jgi:hypothetical protein
MRGDPLKLEQDPDEPVVWLVAGSPACGGQDRGQVQLRDGFEVQQVRAALLATDSVDEQQGTLRLTEPTSCAALAELAERMLDYFETPTQPRPRLQEVQSAVEQQTSRPGDAMPLMALAWLDIIVREDLADVARGAAGIWTDRQLLIETEPHCHRRLEEVRQRYARRAALRMAPSARARHRRPGDAKTG